ELGSSSPVSQASNLVWNETIYALHDSNATTLTLGIWHHLDGHKDALCAIGQVATDGIKDSVLQGPVDFEGLGTVNIRLEMIPETPDALRSIKKMIRLFVDQLSYDFRDRIHEISLKYKTNVLKAFFKDQIEPLTDQDVAEIEAYLAPLFDYMNTNLEVLMSNMEDSLAFEVVFGTWNRFVVDAEALIVPTLHDDQKERKQWDERRFQFFRKFIEASLRPIAFEFFLGDGQGLSRETLHSLPYVGLKSIMANYFQSKEELAQLYLTTSDGVPESKDWILKLIKMKGGREFVDEALKRRCAVEGHLALNLCRPTRFTMLKIRFMGKVSSYLEKDNRGLINETSGITMFKEFTDCLTDELAYNGPGQEFAEGEHIFPFSFRMPPSSLPPSFLGDYGSIKYDVTALLQIPKVSRHSITKELTVPSSRDISTPDYQMDVSKSCDAFAGSLWWKSGYFSINVRLPKTGYSSEETAPVDLFIVNHSQHGIYLKNISLKQKVCYKTIDRTRGPKTERIHRLNYSEHFPPDIREIHRLIRFPIPPTSLMDADITTAIIRVTHSIDINLLSSAPMSKVVKISLPIVIGGFPYLLFEEGMMRRSIDTLPMYDQDRLPDSAAHRRPSLFAGADEKTGHDLGDDQDESSCDDLSLDEEGIVFQTDQLERIVALV
ncbi:Arrestin domain-containing protein 4, partial [Kappamyces sp. JEL0680]